MLFLAFFPFNLSGQNSNERKITPTTELPLIASNFVDSKNLLFKPLFSLPIYLPVYEKENKKEEVEASPVPEARPGDLRAIQVSAREEEVVYDGDVLDHLASKSWNYDEAVQVMMCESSGKRYAFNPEIYAKAMGWTEWSSCGIFQNNDARCNDPNSELYDPIVSIDEAYKKWEVKKDWSPWIRCKKKLEL